MTPGPMDFRGPMVFRKAVSFRGPIEMTLRNQHVKPEDLCFGVHLISTGKTVRIWSSHHFSDQNTAFSPCILDFTKPEIRHICAGPGPTFGPQHHCIHSSYWYKPACTGTACCVLARVLWKKAKTGVIFCGK